MKNLKQIIDRNYMTKLNKATSKITINLKNIISDKLWKDHGAENIEGECTKGIYDETNYTT